MQINVLLSDEFFHREGKP